ncbi:Transferase protein [Actinidia chinensis var. chinensis]|uniref:Transferase protein n=1 Tax=Actinidia chinensis var. chinensis TaxID=1590841 RepID=A0A2R6PHF2_ACTCC|nr:Transferase protein [Actinidia chinensis var. chinensis]
MAEVRLISMSTVKTVSHHGEFTDRIELTPWDLRLLLLDPIQKGLFFLKPTPSQQNELLANTVVEHLKISLSRVLEFFPPLTGRLGITHNDDNTSSFFIDCNNAGAQFIHAVVDTLSVNDILELVYVPQTVHSFFPLNGVCNYQGISEPLLAVQVTELVDGFFIGCSMNHTVADGSSFWDFFNSWSEISRGLGNISQPPALTRWFPSDIDCPIRIPFSMKQMDEKSIVPPVQERVFRFTKEKIAELKAKANAEMSTTSISSLQALLAHLWRAVVRCQHMEANQEVKYVLVVSARPRLQPPLPESYFGNTICGEIVTITAGELVGQTLGWVAWKINRKIALQTNDEIRNFLMCWVKKPKLVTISGYPNNTLYPSSSPRFNVYGNDFGWGKPVAVRSGLANKRDGKITLFPGVEEGSIDIEVCLSPETLLAMGDDEEFMEAIGI